MGQLDNSSQDILSVYAECRFRNIQVSDMTKSAVYATLNIQLSKFDINSIDDFLDGNYSTALRKITLAILGLDQLGDLHLKTILILILAGKKKRFKDNRGSLIGLTEFEQTIDRMVEQILEEPNFSGQIGDVIHILGTTNAKAVYPKAA